MKALEVRRVSPEPVFADIVSANQTPEDIVCCAGNGKYAKKRPIVETGSLARKCEVVHAKKNCI